MSEPFLHFCAGCGVFRAVDEKFFCYECDAPVPTFEDRPPVEFEMPELPKAKVKSGNTLTQEEKDAAVAKFKKDYNIS